MMIDKAIAAAVGVALGVALMTAINPVVVPERIVSELVPAWTGTSTSTAACTVGPNLCIISGPLPVTNGGTWSSFTFGGSSGTSSQYLSTSPAQ